LPPAPPLAYLFLVRYMPHMTQKWRYGLIGAAISLLTGLCLWGPETFEPTDAPEYLHIQVVAYRAGARGSQSFTVVSPASGEPWQVGAARGPFSYDYRGPALLDVRRGPWTGKPHLRLLQDTTSTNTPNQTRERTAIRYMFATSND